MEKKIFARLLEINAKLSYIYDDIQQLINDANDDDFINPLTLPQLIKVLKNIDRLDESIDVEIFWRD